MRKPTLILCVLSACGVAADCLAQTLQQEVDAKMQSILTEFGVPGAAVAVTYEGKLLYTNGYGLADATASPTVAATPTTLFRIASVSKPVTALAVLKLVDQGLLNLDESAFSILNNLTVPGGMTPDPNLLNVTVRQLLQHISGMGGYAYDPMFCANSKDPGMCGPNPTLPDSIAAATGASRPFQCSTIIRYEMGQPLTNPPGQTFDYSNFGYCVLGRIIERKSGKSYEQFVRESVLAPMAIQRMRQGRTQLANRTPTEARYYVGPGDNANGFSVLSPFDSTVPRQYGGFYLESFDSLGGWLASVVDLGRLVARVDSQVAQPVVSPASLDLIRQPPANQPGASVFYGLGFNVALQPAFPPLQHRLWHEGSLPGSRSYITRLASRLGLAVIFNFRYGLNTTQDQQMITQRVHQELASILVWHRNLGTLPTADLFPTYFKPAINTYGIRSEARLDWNQLSPGMYVTILGQNLGPAVNTAVPPVSGRLPTNFQGIRVRIGNLDAPLRYVSATEIGAIVPYGTPAGTQTVTVFSGDEQSLPKAVTVSARYPVLYSTNGTGHALAVAIRPDGTQNTETNRLAVNETFLVKLSGTGATTPSLPDGTLVGRCTGGQANWGYSCIGGTPAAPAPAGSVTATISGVNAPVVFAGSAYGEATGKTLVLVRVPSGLPAAPNGKRPLAVSIGGTWTQGDISIMTQ